MKSKLFLPPWLSEKVRVQVPLPNAVAVREKKSTEVWVTSALALSASVELKGATCQEVPET